MIQKMRARAIEPGVISVFRLFAGLRLALLVLGLLTRGLVHDLPERPDPAGLWFSLADSAILLIYLSWPALERRLKGAYLPIALLLATFGPLLEQYWMLANQTNPSLAAPLVGAWQLLPILFVPLVLISWQYDFRQVVLFCLVTALVEGWLTSQAVNLDQLRILPLIGVIFIRTTAFILVGYMVVRLMANQREQQRALAQANTQLLHYAAALEQLATSRERNRLARELHDTLAHALSGVAVQLEAVKTLWEANPQEARAMLEQSLAATREGLTETRRALQALRASPVEDLGLLLALRNLSESVAARNGLALELDLPPRVENLSPDIEQSVYRIAQEALENAARHAGASRIRVQLSQVDGRLALTIADDGRGFTPGSVDASQHLGLRGIEERSQILGGQFQIDSRPGQGTTIRVAWGGEA